MALTSGSRGNLAYVIFELKFVYPKPKPGGSPTAAPGRSTAPPVALLLLFVGLFVFCCCSFRFVSHCLFVCLFVGLFAHSPSFTITSVSASVSVGGGEVGQSSHCVKFFASTSFGILCQGHWTNSLDLTNMENICTLMYLLATPTAHRAGATPTIRQRFECPLNTFTHVTQRYALDFRSALI